MAVFRKFTLAERLARICGGGLLIFIAVQGYELAPQVALAIGGCGAFFGLQGLARWEKV